MPGFYATCFGFLAIATAAAAAAAAAAIAWVDFRMKYLDCP